MSLSEYFAMGGNAFYVWGAFGMTAFVVAVEIFAVRTRLRAAREAVRGEADR